MLRILNIPRCRRRHSDRLRPSTPIWIKYQTILVFRTDREGPAPTFAHEQDQINMLRAEWAHLDTARAHSDARRSASRSATSGHRSDRQGHRFAQSMRQRSTTSGGSWISLVSLSRRILPMTARSAARRCCHACFGALNAVGDDDASQRSDRDKSPAQPPEEAFRRRVAATAPRSGARRISRASALLALAQGRLATAGRQEQLADPARRGRLLPCSTSRSV